MERRLSAILAADVVGYTRLMSENEADTFDRLTAQRKELFEPEISKRHGRIFKLMGDGLLAEFVSVVDAVECAAVLQREMAKRNEGLAADRRIDLRIGLHVGDVILEGEDRHGDAVNVAARLEQLAEPGGICVSRVVMEQVKQKVRLGFELRGEEHLKNIAESVQVFRVNLDRVDEAQRPSLALPEKPSIAVLPFQNMSGDPEQQYFSDGISEDIITDLSKLSGLFVIARNSSFTYRGKAVKVQDVSRELGVRYVLEGSVRKAGSRVRIVAQLIDGTTGGHLWAERYDRDLTDIFAVQDEVTREIVTALALKLTQGERRRLARKGTDSLEAYDYYLRGRQLVWRRSKEANDHARPLLERAVELDHQFTPAHSILAFVHMLDYLNDWRDPPEGSLRQAHDLAQRAVVLDDDDPEAHWVLGLTYLWLRQHDQASGEARRALGLDPNFAWAHTLLGLVLHYDGHSQAAVAPFKTAMRLDPNYDDVLLHFLAQAYFGGEQYEEAVATLKRRLIRKPDTDISRVLLAACYGHLGRVEEAQAQWREVMRINPGYSLEHRRRVLPYKNPADFERIAAGLRKAGLPE